MKWFAQWLRGWRQLTGSGRQRSTRLRVEKLEDRWVPTGISPDTSANWSGYAINTNAGAVTAVSGSWTVPAVTGSGTGYSAVWVGIDGSNSSSVEQLGTEMDLLNGQANYYAWYEMYPSNSVTISSVPIHPGDAINASVTYNTTASNFVLSITDLTTGGSFTTTQSSPYAQESSAEWILEAPETSRFGGKQSGDSAPQSAPTGIVEPPFSHSGVSPLANFGSVTFTNAQATINGVTGAITNSSTAWENANAVVDQINLVSGRTDAVEAAATSLTASGSGFSVTAVTPMTATGQSLTAVAGATFSGTVATFTDSDSLGTTSFTATIAWGDGTTSAGTVVANALGGYSVSGTHTYSSGLFAVSVTIQDADGNSAIVEDTATVAAASPYFTVSLAFLQSSEYDTDLVTRDYQQYLGRTPNSSEVSYWVNALQQGTTDVQVLGGFLSSPEFYSRAGSTNTDWLDALYLDVLGRPADSAGESYWLQQLSTGVSRQTIALAFLTSPEYESDFVGKVYQQYLGRTGSTVEIAYWVNLMQQGAADTQVEASILASPEYYAHVGNSDKAWVTSLYQTLLNRTPDSSGESYWLQVLSSEND